MSLLEKVLGPKSKYDASLPYTYEARIRTFAEDEEHKSYFSDTICGLVEYLHAHRISPDDVEIVEVFLDQEVSIDPRLFASEHQWLFKPAICQAFVRHYPGHIHGSTCSFKDRDRSARGP